MMMDDRPMEFLVDMVTTVPAGTTEDEVVSLAASVACELLHRGYRVGLAARGEELTAEGGPAQAIRVLRFLALVGPAAADLAAPIAELTFATSAAAVDITCGCVVKPVIGHPLPEGYFYYRRRV